MIDADELPGGAFAAVRHADFRPYFVTGLLSMMADNVEHVISNWVIFQASIALSAVAFLVVGVGLLAYANGRVRRLAAA